MPLLFFDKDGFGVIYPMEVDVLLNKETKPNLVLRPENFLAYSHTNSGSSKYSEYWTRCSVLCISLWYIYIYIYVYIYIYIYIYIDTIINLKKHYDWLKCQPVNEVRKSNLLYVYIFCVVASSEFSVHSYLVSSIPINDFFSLFVLSP